MNNFDQSSTGLNITVSAFRDTDLSRFYFEEVFFTIKEGRKELLVYCEGNYSDFEKEYSFTKVELINAYIDYVGDSYGKQAFNNDLAIYCNFPASKATKQDIIDFIKNDLYEEYEWHSFCDKAGFKSNFAIVVSRGYCQGDHREVIVPHRFWDCIGVKKPDSVQSNLGRYIDNLLWDCPIYACFTVNDSDFDICGSLSSMYNWDKSEALEIAKNLIKDSFTSEEQNIIMDFLDNALNTGLDYL